MPNRYWPSAIPTCRPPPLCRAVHGPPSTIATPSTTRHPPWPTPTPPLSAIATTGTTGHRPPATRRPPPAAHTARTVTVHHNRAGHQAKPEPSLHPQRASFAITCPNPRLKPKSRTSVTSRSSLMSHSCAIFTGSPLPERFGSRSSGRLNAPATLDRRHGKKAYGRKQGLRDPDLPQGPRPSSPGTDPANPNIQNPLSHARTVTQM